MFRNSGITFQAPKSISVALYEVFSFIDFHPDFFSSPVYFPRFTD